MTNPLLSNYVGNQEVILWQYDKAPNLISLISKWNDYAKSSCESFWNYFGNRILPIDQADTLGLNVIGNLMGIPRPRIMIGSKEDEFENVSHVITSYIIPGKWILSGNNASMTEFMEANKDSLTVSVVESTEEGKWTCTLGGYDETVYTIEPVELTQEERPTSVEFTVVLKSDGTSVGTLTAYNPKDFTPTVTDERDELGRILIRFQKEESSTSVLIPEGDKIVVSTDVSSIRSLANDGYEIVGTPKDNAKIVTITNDLYRRLLKARFFLYMKPPTAENYNRYLAILFGATKDNDTKTYYDNDIFDDDGNVVEGFFSRNMAIDMMDMSMGFTFPKNATTEEAYLIFQHYDTVYPFPAGIRYPGEFIIYDKVIGLNGEGQAAVEQNYRNFVDGLVLAEDDEDGNPNGGIFSNTDRANYVANMAVHGNAYVIEIDANAEKTTRVTLQNDNSEMTYVWIGWGDGDGSYEYIPDSGSREITHTYSKDKDNTRLLSIVVLYGNGVEITEEPETNVNYELMV